MSSLHEAQSAVHVFKTEQTTHSIKTKQTKEMRWKNFGETTTEEGHKVFFSGKEDKQQHTAGEHTFSPTLEWTPILLAVVALSTCSL